MALPVDESFPNETDNNTFNSAVNGGVNDNSNHNETVIHLDIKEDACRSSEDVLHNLRFFHALRTKIEYSDDWLDDKIIDNLNHTRTSTTKEILPLVEAVAMEAYRYNDAIDSAVESTEEILRDMNDHINADLEIIYFIEKNLDDLNDTNKLSKTCSILEDVKRIEYEFSGGIDACVDYFKKKVAPELTDMITPGIKELTLDSENPNVDAVAVKIKYEGLLNSLKRGAETISELVEISRNDFEKCTTERALEYSNSIEFSKSSKLEQIIGLNKKFN